MQFSNEKEKTNFVGLVRLFADDLNDFAGFAGTTAALEQRANDKRLLAVLNSNAEFWQSVLHAQRTSMFVVVGRVHDSRRSAYLRRILEHLKGSRRDPEGRLYRQFHTLLHTHKVFIKKSMDLRHHVFAHSSEHRTLVATFAVQGITWQTIVNYWRDIAGAVEQLELSIFEGDYGPKFRADVLEDEIAAANRFFNSLVATSGQV